MEVASFLKRLKRKRIKRGKESGMMERGEENGNNREGFLASEKEMYEDEKERRKEGGERRNHT